MVNFISSWIIIFIANFTLLCIYIYARTVNRTFLMMIEPNIVNLICNTDKTFYLLSEWYMYGSEILIHRNFPCWQKAIFFYHRTIFSVLMKMTNKNFFSLHFRIYIFLKKIILFCIHTLCYSEPWIKGETKMVNQWY